jgi:hypothetical protein
MGGAGFGGELCQILLLDIILLTPPLQLIEFMVSRCLGMSRRISSN